MLKLVKNYGLPFGILAIILIFGSIIYFNEAIYSWLDFNDSEKYSVSTYYEIIRNISLGISAGIGILLALWRIKILNDQTKIENDKLLLETEQIKFDMQAKTLEKVWSYVVELDVNNAKVLSLYQDSTDLSQYSYAFLRGYFEKKGLSGSKAHEIIKGPKDRIKENFLMSIFPKKIIAILESYDDFCTTYAKNKILLFPEMIKELDKFKDEINKIMLANNEILMKQIQHNEDILKNKNTTTTLLNEDVEKIEKGIKDTEKICNEIEKIIQDFLFSHISNSKNK